MTPMKRNGTMVPNRALGPCGAGAGAAWARIMAKEIREGDMAEKSEEYCVDCRGRPTDSFCLILLADQERGGPPPQARSGPTTFEVRSRSQPGFRPDNRSSTPATRGCSTAALASRFTQRRPR